MICHRRGHNCTTSRRRLQVVVGVLRWGGWRLNAQMTEGPPGNLGEPSSPVHPGSRQWTDAGSDYPGLAQVDVDRLGLPGHKMPVAVRETLDHLSRSPTLGVVFRH